ncbi:MAG: hypothetical protein Q8L54_00240 [Devosia sp.]|nr:hypothetical protein [Devosia sp.]
MSLRPPDLLAARLRSDEGINLLESEMLAEKASSLGLHGRLVEQALAALRAFEGDPEERLRLVKKAAREVWAFFVQRELRGLRDQKEVIRFHDIPPEVPARLGAMEK